MSIPSEASLPRHVGRSAALRHFRKLGLATRLALSCSVALAALGLLLVSLITRVEVTALHDEVQEHLEHDLQLLQSNIALHAAHADHHAATEFLETFAKQPGIERVIWQSAAGWRFEAGGSPPTHRAPAWVEHWLALPESVASTPVLFRGADHGTVTVRLNSAVAAATIWSLMVKGMTLVLLGLATTWLVLHLIVWRALQPLHRLAEGAARFGEGDFEARIRRSGTPEVVAVITAFNSMAERLQALFASLRASQAHNHMLASVVEQTSESIVAIDLQGRVTLWNTGAEQLFGWRASEALGQSLRDLYLRDADAEAVSNVLARLLAKESFVTRALRTTQSGVQRHISSANTPLLDESGAVIGGISVARDITESVKARLDLQDTNQMLEGLVRERMQELSQHEALLRAVVDAIPGVLAYQDTASRRFLLVNRGMSEWMGLPPSAILGRTPAEIGFGSVAEKLTPHTQRVLAGHVERTEITHHVRNGQPSVLDVTLVPVATKGAEVDGIVSFCRDITRIRQSELAQRAVEKKNRLLATMVEQSNDAIHARDLDGRVTYWNAAAERILGFSADEALGQPLRALHMRDLSDEAIDVVMQRIRSGKVAALEAQRVNRAGEAIDVAINTAPLFDEAGRHAGEICVHRDITAAKQAERTLRHAMATAEAANRAKSEFLANMSHEIRTPLNGVLGLTDIVLGSKLTREQRADLELVRASGTSLMSIINDVLDFSKIEAGHLRLEEIEFAPADEIADMVKVLAIRAHEKNLPLVYDAHGLPPRLQGDPQRIRQIVLNLVGNAIKFTERGEVSVTVSALPPAPHDAASVILQIAVRDSGIGIAAEKLSSIFNQFEQADASITRRYGGTGLGLAVCSKLAALMGGAVSVDSVLGSGTTFTVTLRCRLPATQSHNADPTPSALAGRSLLVVEPNRNYRDALMRLAASWGLACQAAEDLEQAQALVAAARGADRSFDAVLLDARPHGRDAVQWARQQLGAESPGLGAVLVMAPTGQRGEAERCREAGFAGYLLKPLRPGELFDALLGSFDPATRSRAEAAASIAREPSRQSGHGANVLVVEDNETNQMLARRVLKLLGHQVQIAENGQLGLEAAAQQRFDVILMDMQMPVMGGLEAAAAIRRHEAGSGVRVPIVALTANAMEGDRESCLAAGMDDYMTKPYTHEQLRTVLGRWLAQSKPTAPAAATEAPGTAPAAAQAHLDLAVLRGYVGDDDATVEEFLSSFLANADKLELRLHDGLRERNAAAVGACAHQLKSSARMVGALPLGDLCAALEAAGKAQDWPAIDAAMSRFDGSLGSVRSTAAEWLSAFVT